ncbi:MAG TPA: hypothetical protein VEB42_08400 [Chitinophagaceae bacterium]|nr:hypothetical protein [Chitinophagaceae bacterium]
MKKEVTYNDLWLIDQDITNIRANMPALWIVLEAKFLTILLGKNNKPHVERLHRRMKEIQKKYIVHDEEDNPVKEVKEGKGPDWKYLESAVGKNGSLLTGDEVEKAYYEEAGEFLKRSVTIEF